jgi:peptidoglycan/LPS O-acetylase OafA/YrhL
MTIHNHHPTYRPDIDGLRAVAILAVVFFHAFPDAVPGGFVGVDVFFVISGYLISTILIRSLETRQFSFGEFYAKRIRRIFPALVAVLAATYAMGLWLLNAEELRLLGKHMAAGAGFVQNVVLEREADYFDVATTLKPLMHLWSLSIEEQFYLLFPALLWIGSRVGMRLEIGIAILILLSFGLNVANVHEYPTTVFFAPQTRFWELWVGGALVYVGRRKFTMLTNHVLAWLGALLLGLSIFTLSEDFAFPGAWAALPVAGAALLILAGAAGHINRNVLSQPAMVWVGLISFPLYLWHWPLLSFLRIVEEAEPSTEWKWAAVVLSFLLAWATYRWIELPSRAWVASKTVVTGLSVALLLLGCLGFATYRWSSTPAQPALSQHPTNKPVDAKATPNTDALCKQILPQLGDVECHSTSDNTSAQVALVGDSHASHTYLGLAEALPSSSGLINLACGGCLPLHGVTGSAGTQSLKKSQQMEKMLDWITASKEVKVVILAARGPMYITGKGYKETRKNIKLSLLAHPEERDPAEVFKQGLRSTLSQLQSAGKRTIVLLDVPELGFDPKSCLTVRPLTLHERKVKATCAVPRAAFDERNAGYRQLVQEAARGFTQVAVFDAAAPFCDAQWCWGMRGDVVYYSDNNHLTLEGSRLLAQPLAQMVESRLR